MQVEAIDPAKKTTTKKLQKNEIPFPSIWSILQVFLLTSFLFVMLGRKFLMQNDLSELAEH